MTKFSAYSFAAFLVFVAVIGHFSFQEPSNASRRTTAANVESSDCAALNDSNGTSFDWTAINSDEQLQGCLLTLARNLENVEMMSDWLIAQGFSNVFVFSDTSDSIRLNATWDVSISKLPVPFWENLWFFQRWTTNGKNFSVQVVYRETTPISANAHFLIL